jgi:hypothetical protein
LPVREEIEGGVVPLATPDAPEIRVVLRALRELDVRLAAAAEAVKVLFGPESSRDLFRGLHVTPADADRALRVPPIAPLFGPLGFEAPLIPPEALAGTRFEGLRRAFDLESFDLDVLLLALAPEIDARYERLYAFLQDDVAQKRPTVDLALNVFCRSIDEKLDRLRRFDADAPLLRHGIVRLGGGAGPTLDSPRLLRSIAVDGTVIAHVLGHRTLDGRIAPYGRLIEPDAGGVRRASGRAARAIGRAERGGVFYLRGADQQQILAAVREAAAGRAVLALDAERALASGADWDALLAVALRTARLGGYVSFVHDVDRLWDAEQQHPRLRQLLHLLADHPGLVCLSGAETWRPGPGSGGAHVVPIDVDHVHAGARQRVWSRQLAERGAKAPPAAVAATAAAFDLTRAQIARAVVHAIHLAERRGRRSPTRDDLFQGARLQTRGPLLGLAERFEVNATWDDLVLPAETIAQLREIGLRVAKRGTVLGDWGFGRKRTYGKGTAVLFAGPSGTGKTFAAAVLARDVGLDLHRIDLSSVVSKYIGETEKNLARVFKAANNCMLLFDEAEALFGKRSEVRDAHDRYANQELSFLLQRIEQFDGVAILTTNLPGSMDEAFRRRLAATVYFPLPDEPARRRLWQRAWPADAPLAADVDVDLLASRFHVSGGIIAQAALGAAYLAAEAGPQIRMSHVLRALRREFEALGIPAPDVPVPHDDAPAAG